MCLYTLLYVYSIVYVYIFTLFFLFYFNILDEIDNQKWKRMLQLTELCIEDGGLLPCKLYRERRNSSIKCRPNISRLQCYDEYITKLFSKPRNTVRVVGKRF